MNAFEMWAELPVCDWGECRGNLAVILKEQGDYNRSLQLFEQVVCIKRGQPEPDELDISNNLSNMALLLEAMGEHHQAIPVCEEAIRIRQAKLGEEHLDCPQKLATTETTQRISLVGAAGRMLRRGK